MLSSFELPYMPFIGVDIMLGVNGVIAAAARGWTEPLLILWKVLFLSIVDDFMES